MLLKLGFLGHMADYGGKLSVWIRIGKNKSCQKPIDSAKGRYSELEERLKEYIQNEVWKETEDNTTDSKTYKQ